MMSARTPLSRLSLAVALVVTALLAPACADGAATGDGLETRAQSLVTWAPGPGGTIQSAIDEAQAGDTVMIGEGSWEETLTMKSGVSVIGTGTGTIIYGSVTSDAIDAVLQDLVVDGSVGSVTNGVTVTTGSLTIKGVTVRGVQYGLRVPVEAFLPTVTVDGCHFTGASGAGARIDEDADLAIWNSLFTYNSQDGLQIAKAEFFGSATVGHNLFFANGFGLADGTGIWSLYDEVTIANNIITSNNVGLYCSGSCTAHHNLVWGNSTNHGGAAAPGAGNIHKDPRMTSPAEGDFSLLFDSPAVDAGDPAVSTDHDYQGTQRPLGDGPDLGAFEFPLAPPAKTLAITEIMANPLNEGTGEYVELLNYGTEPVDAAGLWLDDGDAKDLVVGWDGGATIIDAGEFAIILDPGYDGTPYTIPADAVRLTIATTAALGSGLSNNDPVRLFDTDGTSPIDSYSFPFDAGNGTSVEKDSVDDGDFAGNWVASPCGRTPGSSNCASLPPTAPTEVLIAINEVMTNPLSETTGEFIELYNFGTGPIDLEGMIFADGDTTDVITAAGDDAIIEPGQYAVILDPDFTDEYEIPADALLLTVATSKTLGNGLSVSDPISLLDPTGLTVIDTYTHFVDPGNGISMEKVASNIADIQSNYVASTCLSGSSPGAVNCVTLDGLNPVSGNTFAIMEIMANPLNEDTGEYIELLNYGSEALDLAGFRISDGDKEEQLQAFEAGASTVVEPGGYALILDSEYDGTYAIPEGTVLLTTPDTTIGTGLSNNDEIRLRGPKGAKAIDSYFFPFNAGNGVSVEKIDILVGDVPQNWAASACQASPGASNCNAVTGGSSASVSTTHITISEVLANALDEGTGEFVELFNAGPVGVDVAGWWLSDGGQTDMIQGFNGGSTLIAPGEFAVILDSDYTNGTYDIPAGTVKLTTGDKTLGNGLTTSDAVTLYEANGVTQAAAFSFPYNAGNGKSVEKVTLTGGDSQANWVTSPCSVASGDDNNFISPGSVNCADPYGGITGTNALGESCPSGSGDCLSGLCAIELVSGGTFCTEDCSGGGSCSSGFECVPVSDPNYTDVCSPLGGGAVPEVWINEILYDAEGADAEVFLELVGTPDTILDGVTLIAINGNNGDSYREIYLTGQIPADGYFVIAGVNATGDIAAAADMTANVDFQNGPDSLQVRYGNETLDALAYGGDFAPDEWAAGEGASAPDATGDDQSLGRLPDGMDTDDNATDFVITTPTPGAENAL